MFFVMMHLCTIQFFSEHFQPAVVVSPQGRTCCCSLLVFLTYLAGQLVTVITGGVIIIKAMLSLLETTPRVELYHHPKKKWCAEKPEQSRNKCCQTHVDDQLQHKAYEQGCHVQQSCSEELSPEDHVDISLSRNKDELLSPEPNHSFTLQPRDVTVTLQGSDQSNQQSEQQLASQQPSRQVLSSRHGHQQSLSTETPGAVVADEFKPEDILFRPPTATLAKETRTRKKGPGRTMEVSPRFLGESLAALPRAVTFERKRQAQKLEAQEIASKKADKSTILKELISSPAIRFAPEVQEVYMMREGPTQDDPSQPRRYREESARLASFFLYVSPSPRVWITRVAAAGFYLPDEGSSVVRFVAIFCSCCEGV